MPLDPPDDPFVAEPCTRCGRPTELDPCEACEPPEPQPGTRAAYLAQLDEIADTLKAMAEENHRALGKMR